MKPLTLYPAIDLKDGACVRLRRGEMDQATIYGDDPAAQAQAWEDAGCSWLHVVDLNGAFSGRPVNETAVKAILAAVKIPVQLGGGIRDMLSIRMWLEVGVRRVILGSAAVRRQDLVREACASFPGRIAVAIDARDGLVATEGWGETSQLTVADLTLGLQDAGVAAFIYTDISRDGMLTGINIEATVALARTVSVPIIASGGVSGIKDLMDLRQAAADTTIEGVVVGRALYDGRLDPKDAIVALRR